MKKLIALLLAVSVLFSLALTGCKSETPDDIGDNETAASGKDPRPLYRSPQCSDCTSHCRGAACPSRSNTGSLHRVSKNGVHQLRL